MSLWRTLLDKLTLQQPLNGREILLSTLVALFAMTLVTWISYRFLAAATAPFMVASMGASTVLLAAVPSSPMNRAWPLLGGHLVSAVIGVTCTLHLPYIVFAIPVAVTSAILAMLLLRCLHPPGGATALLTVLAGAEIPLDYQFVATPVMLNAIALWGTVRATGFLLELHKEQERFELPPELRKDAINELSLKPPFEAEDLHHALNHFDTFIDTSEEELLRLYQQAKHHYHRRHLGDLRCSDLMIPNPVAAEFGTALQEAWEWLSRHQITAVPVINQARHVIGIVTLDDFIHHAQGQPGATLEARLQTLIRATPGPNSDKPEVVGQIMTQPVISAPESSHVAELLPLLDERQVHHLPIVNDEAKLVGVLNRNQIVSILQQSAAPPPI